MKIVMVSIAALLLSACGGGVVVRDRIVEVKVPVQVPCRLGERPNAPVSLNLQMSKDDWEKLTTDQREALIAAQALRRKVHADRLEVNTAGCE